MNSFRLTYLKSTGLEKMVAEEPFSSGDGKMRCPPSPSPGDLIPKAFSSEAILKQAKADLKHPDPRVRTFAVRYYLEKSYPAIPLSLLQEVLSDQDPDVRAQALHTLVRFRSPVLSSLLRKYLRDSDPRVRIAALRGMFQYQEKIDLNLFVQFLSDESIWVRRKVATLLGWSQVEGALPILIQLSKDEHPMVRRAALFSLTTLYPDESEKLLMEAMTDLDPDLRTWARTTLEKILAGPLKQRKAYLTNRG